MKIIIIMFIITSSSQLFSQSDITYDAGTSIDVGAGADICATNVYINGTFSGTGTICSGALPVTLSSFEARITKNNVKLIWVTEIETNNSGFNIERQKANGTWEKLGFVQGSGTTNSARIYTFEDLKLAAKTYKYRLKQIDFNGNFEYYDLTSDVVINAPNAFSVSQNYPNPSNPKSKIDLQMPFDGKVTIKVYDVAGREAATLVDETRTADFYTLVFDGSNLASGVYFYRIIAEGEGQKFNKTMKMVLVK